MASMFPDLFKDPMVVDDEEAAFEAAGVNMEADPEEPSEQAPTEEFNQEEMLMEALLDQLIQEKNDSLAYQDSMKNLNTEQLREADRLRRKLGG